MPDTPKNQACYPQPPTQKPGLGFPLARITVLLSLATGACHDLAIAPYKGKGTGETTLLRTDFGVGTSQEWTGEKPIAHAVKVTVDLTAARR